ncbi:lipase family protein [Chryseobacterium bernardetii]|uniref:lipase family protein n=1 Tax=Chryseobacterium bernardetii TaxID=1241978 RepID=UPI0030181068
MTNPSLDAYQQVFGLACLANRTGGYNGSCNQLQQQLQYDLSYYFNNVPPVAAAGQQGPSVVAPSVLPVLGNWNLVWGPALVEETDSYGQPTGVADNALYVAQCDALTFPGGPVLPVYVVAIAATNPASLYDWETEDFSVSEVVNWTTYDPSAIVTSEYNGNDPYISKGTATGISILLGLTSPETAASPGTTLQQFIAGLQPDADTAIIFCGHSLAGALSPTLALYLQEQQELEAFAITLVYPTAGPTPGDINFANRFNNVFPSLPSGWTPQAGDYQSWNTMHWNDLDVVPHAWQESNMALIADLYGKSPDPYTYGILKALQDFAIIDSLKSSAPYTMIRNQSLSGTLQNYGSSGRITIPPQSIYDYVSQLFLQHTYLYYGRIAGKNLPEITGIILSQPLPESETDYLIPGITSVTEDEMILKIISQISQWIKSHIHFTEQQSIETEADNSSKILK